MRNDLYTLTSTVVTGDHYGEVLGFPTANLDINQLGSVVKDIPRGVYGGLVTRKLDNSTYKAGIVVGAQDTHKPPKIEAHLIDFTGNMYGETLTFHIKKFLREIHSYDHEDELKTDIQKDLDHIKKLKL